MPNALEVEHLTVSFGGRPVFSDLSFTVASGSALTVIGPNGAGKTVLLKALIGALPSRGTIRWAAGTRIGYVPQRLDIERDLPLTGAELIDAKVNVLHAPATDTARVIALVGLDLPTAARPIGTLSGGQFQRLLVALALVGTPNVLLFDEPTAGVDEPGEVGIYTLFRRLQQEEKLTLILVSHELSLVYRYADNVLCLSPTHSCFGPPMEILTPERLQEVYGTRMMFHGHEGHRHIAQS
jgi:zinc transport system ATP-binding protein